MKRLARINGSVKAIITGDEQINCIFVNGKMEMPVKFFDQNESVHVIIQNGKHFNLTIGESYENLKGWEFENDRYYKWLVEKNTPDFPV